MHLTNLELLHYGVETLGFLIPTNTTVTFSDFATRIRAYYASDKAWVVAQAFDNAEGSITRKVCGEITVNVRMTQTDLLLNHREMCPDSPLYSLEKVN